MDKNKKKKKKNSSEIKRYHFFAVILMIVGFASLAKALMLMTVNRSEWTEIDPKMDSIIIAPIRGEILAADGQPLVSSTSKYMPKMDFVAPKNVNEEKRLQAQHDFDSTITANMTAICEGLHRLLPDQSADEFRKRFKVGMEKKTHCQKIYDKYITYSQNEDVTKLLSTLIGKKSGYCPEERTERNHTYGSLAYRTIGSFFNGKDSAKMGIELAYDSILRGTPGWATRMKVRSKMLNIATTDPVNGFDINTTIDVNMQDVCEKALVEQMEQIGGYTGVVILMEVKTGNIKAIVNMERAADGHFYESKNHAIADMMEPGSTFKTASMMVALDDGVISINDSVDTGCGIYNMHGSPMKDHNWTRGGYQWLTVPQVLMVSSNIGVSRIIDEHYSKNPKKFVDGLYRIGIGQKLGLPLAGAADPSIRYPNNERHYWSKTTLPWMSIGYETQIPPISTLAFYNAIANGGKMIKPRFVSSYSKNGETVYEYPVEVLKERICKPQTLKLVRNMLWKVVNQKEDAHNKVHGLGSPAACKGFDVAGKTGTAQILNGGCFSAARRYLVSFCGFYPYNDPKYTCIVAIQKNGLPASGGLQAGSVFSKIASRVMAMETSERNAIVSDSTHISMPYVKNGDVAAAGYILNELGINNTGWSTKNITSNPVWGRTDSSNRTIVIKKEICNNSNVPNVHGMGARDAVYKLESLGLRVRIEGKGRVVEQSIPAGVKIEKGKTINIKLSTQFNNKELA